MKRLIASAVIVLFLASAAAWSQSCPMMGGGGMKDGKGMGMMHKGGGGMGIGRILMQAPQLKLTEDQITKIRKIQLANQRDQIKRQGEVRLLNLDLSENLSSGNPDFNAAKSTMKKISDLRLQSRNAMIDAYAQVYNLLTPEQKGMLKGMGPAFGGGTGGGGGEEEEMEEE